MKIEEEISLSYLIVAEEEVVEMPRFFLQTYVFIEIRHQQNRTIVSGHHVRIRMH